MRKFKTTFYDRATGVEFSVLWENQEQFARGIAYLNGLTGGSYGTIKSDPDRPDLYVLETEQQRDAIFEFRRRMRNEIARPARAVDYNR